MDKDKAGCSAVGYQDVNVCIPVTIKPFGEAGNAKTKCLGKAVVSSGWDKCASLPSARSCALKFLLSLVQEQRLGKHPLIAVVQRVISVSNRL